MPRRLEQPERLPFNESDSFGLLLPMLWISVPESLTPKRRRNNPHVAACLHDYSPSMLSKLACTVSVWRPSRKSVTLESPPEKTPVGAGNWSAQSAGKASEVTLLAPK